MGKRRVRSLFKRANRSATPKDWQHESLPDHITPSGDAGNQPAESSAIISASGHQNVSRQETTFDPRIFPDGIDV